MKALKIIIFSTLLASYNFIVAQNGEVINDTLWIIPSATKSIEFSKALGTTIYIKNIIPDDISAKQRRIQIISSTNKEIDEKKITVINNKDIVLPLIIFTERYYTLYIKKNNATVESKKLIIR